ncbi:ATP-dependent protease La [Anaplasma phagocytophilum str. ApWI1]|uniref:Lon protease n=1 Tax=Anaplasma phagocytophilum str. ApWI1 TaxID=1359155 RepID=A0A0F3PW31_ANAPH|nr:ATP-dependent protease La [Anaplasma phagocytophilum str. Webster]KJV83482.1 ATP-dependent protease La [Anaplasma phagocytophilum str. HGE2]KJV84493.1 ATP-dependent protease La [Anaplasma phagocytophilum str. ApWI1]KJV87152.1 ATP-dependent protease La [Anaplasma phagocytophilum str. ApNYW]KJV98283.1 ATP-dependent protease La [Anaplasma phagocytophilum str. Annie]KJZ98429.1 ATP-dependent protease La [Anaplasma phagocytophilum str. CR1007]KJZ99957.1 ATP-dependent protease La [Anaplasma phago
MLLPVLMLRDTVVFPRVVVPLSVGRGKSVNALEYTAKTEGCKILLLTQIDGSVDNPGNDDLYTVGVVADVVQLLRLPDGVLKVLIKGESRAKVLNLVDEGDFLSASVEIIEDDEDVEIDSRVEALRRSVLREFDVWNKLSKKMQPEVVASTYEIKKLGHLSDVVASHLAVSIEDKQKVIEEFCVVKRLDLVFGMIKLEIGVLNAQKKIDDRVRSQVEATHKVYYLNEQLKAIQRELEESDGSCCDSDSASEFEKRINATPLSEEARERALSDLKRYRKMNLMSPEANIISGYMQWLLDLPWGKFKSGKIDMTSSAKILNNNHFGMDKVKERVLEFLAVLKRVKKPKGSVLCFVGPPGVGKTSLAKSIAEATGREFVRVSLGGVHDESEIRGHRRTYVGAMPGKIIKQMKRAKTCNPLFLLDEIDKVGSDYRGDPVAALLEVLDPEHNKHFVDNYLEVEFDLSNVMFVATANNLNFQKPLLDRMEIIQLSGYTEEEKLQIAKVHLIPGLRKEHGLREKEWDISAEAICDLIRFYTRESGVRGLRRELSSLMRGAVKEILTNKDVKSVFVTPENVDKYVGVRKYDYGIKEKSSMVGVVTGLAYTETGGDLLTIESVMMPGRGGIKCTGKLGEVMQESVKAAYSYVRSRCFEFGIKSKDFQSKDIHVHVPEGAIPKDGPSAGIAMCISIVSLMTGIPVKNSVAMTGEVTLRGRVLPIGGLKEKLLAAMRGGVTTVILPIKNKKDFAELPESVKQSLELVLVSSVDEVIACALESPVVPLSEDEVFVNQMSGVGDCSFLN